MVDFGNATFNAGADFTKVTFPGPVLFDGTTFNGPVMLDRARFRDAVWFLRTTMTIGAFTDATFGGFTGFHEVRAEQMIFFTGTTFSGRTHLEDVALTMLGFTDLVFTRRVTLILEGACVFIGVRFDEGLELRLRSTATAVLRRTHFGAASTITSDSELTATDGGSALRALRPAQVLSLQDTDVEKLGLVGVDLQRCLFAGALNLDKLSLSGPISFARLHRPVRHVSDALAHPLVAGWS